VTRFEKQRLDIFTRESVYSCPVPSLHDKAGSTNTRRALVVRSYSQLCTLLQCTLLSSQFDERPTSARWASLAFVVRSSSWFNECSMNARSIRMLDTASIYQARRAHMNSSLLRRVNGVLHLLPFIIVCLLSSDSFTLNHVKF